MPGARRARCGLSAAWATSWAALVAAPGAASAAVLVVDAAAGPYRDVPAALADAEEGDEIVVAPGTVSGPLDLAFGDPTLPDDAGAPLLPRVTLRARDGVAVTTVDAGEAPFAVRLPPGGVLEGFALHGEGDGVRVAVAAGDASPAEVRHCDIRTSGGYGVRAIDGAAARVEATAVSGARTAGISLAAGEARANLVIGVPGVGVVLAGAAASASNNQVCGCGTGIKAKEGAAGDVLHNGVVLSGTGIAVDEGALPARLEMNVVAWSDVAFVCPGPAASSQGFNDAWESGIDGSCPPAGTDLAVDPAFALVQVDQRACGGLDMRLMPLSALVDAGDPGEADPDGTRADVGPFGGAHAAAWDLDGDGALRGSDCDDGDARAVPGGAEACGDGIDNDCDGVADDVESCPYPDLEGLYCGSAGRRGTGGGLAALLAWFGWLVACRRGRVTRPLARPSAAGSLGLAAALLALTPSDVSAGATDPAIGPPGGSAAAPSAPVALPAFVATVRGGYLRFGLSAFGALDASAWTFIARTPFQVGGGFTAGWRRDDEGSLRWVPLGRIGAGARLDKGALVPVVRGVLLVGAWNAETREVVAGGGAELMLLVRPRARPGPAIEAGVLVGGVDGRLVFLGSGGFAFTL